MLKQLGVEKNWIYEVLLSSYFNGVPHVAPFGVRTTDYTCVTLDMYEGSRSLRNILAVKEFALNTVQDTEIFYHALFAGGKIKYGPAEKIDAPVLMDSPASMEAKVVSVTPKAQRVVIEAEIVHIQNRRKCDLTNRAQSLLLESLIVATRIPHLPEGKPGKLLRENYRVIKKVAPGSKYEDTMRKLLHKCDI